MAAAAAEQNRQAGFHTIEAVTDEEAVEVVCVACGKLDAPYGADHSIVTGHTVTQAVLVTTTFREKKP